jgi:hypothetical protein
MHALNKWLATLLLAGGLADTQPAAAAPKYKVLYSFKGGSDGAGPNWNAR